MASRVLLWSAVAAALGVGTRAAWRLQESVALARLREPLQRSPERHSLRLLVVGDSTARGTGASAPPSSVAGLLAQAFPRLLIDNRAGDG